MAPNNSLPIWGNEKTMNLNPLILTNIQSSPYFKVKLYELKTYHEVIDEIYYKVEHLEPWERGSRKTAGQTGMCGGVRGVGAGGIVSSAYCLLYKLFTLRLTRKQVNGLISHKDSPFIRGLGFMYIRYTQDPKELWEWYEPYLEDEEEIDVKAGGGHVMMMGDMIRQWLTKLEWYSTLFPRIPVPVQKDLMMKLKEHSNKLQQAQQNGTEEEYYEGNEEPSFGEAERQSGRRERSPERKPTRSPKRSHTPPKRSPRRSPRRSPPRRHSPDRRRSPHKRSPDRRLRDPEGGDFARDLQRERERQRREKEGSSHRRSRSRERKRRSNSRDRHRRSRERTSKGHKKHSKSQSPERSRDKHRRHSRSRSRERHSKHSHSHHDRHREKGSHDRHRNGES